MLNKTNYAASFSDIIQQNKIWANMAVSRKPATKNLKVQRMAYGTYKVHTTEW